MKDYLVRIITRTAQIRALACVTTNLSNEACRRHNAYPTPCVALGRALTGGVLLGALLKTGQRVALKFEGDGPLKKIIVEAESNGAVRGYVRVPQVDLPAKDGKIDVAGALGSSGLLTVTKDLRLKEPYKGVVKLYTGEIAEDLAYYLTESEQIPSAVGLGVYVEPEAGVSAAGGFLIQSFPPYDEEVVDKLIGRIQEIPTVTHLIRNGISPEELLEMLFAGIPFEILEKRALGYQCSCSKERVERAIISLGREELAALIAEQGNVEVRCEFCRESYQFTENDLRLLFEEIQ
ncbi:MAG: Hsp33 family molecular chaperone HslO [Deltaproteobacteria bacterium]|nr:MAG: Hsp33 family molecular chaperone HslO [Deltaproteobacteria bacterium]